MQDISILLKYPYMLGNWQVGLAWLVCFFLYIYHFELVSQWKNNWPQPSPSFRLTAVSLLWENNWNHFEFTAWRLDTVHRNHGYYYIAMPWTHINYVNEGCQVHYAFHREKIHEFVYAGSSSLKVHTATHLRMWRVQRILLYSFTFVASTSLHSF